MSLHSLSRIFFASAIAAALLMFAYSAHASSSSIDSALNSSLQDSREINNEMDHTLQRPKPASKHVAARETVEINLDAPDAKNAAVYKKDAQANGSLRESSY